ncbi:TetR/AcrR family transcriptional regulator [Paramicrobacterium chengjingii]|uniref:TetR/AcrR family transcriptional regulator n=1 Tax=Paramicrobacterium chengjingii TaxID=2769067 RepID=A0ABX6YGF3_9MICO|nr:TetR/AcrR family transcriptional regulator [Microbacterium chengjingii]QPZ37874.1 TetR/AcrR family transcriptional regulator [Microbacterium chengjingii]
MSPRDSYHHGNLRAELIEAALAEARRSGPDAIGLRSITRQLRVSPNATYRHFADRQALIAAVAQAIQGKMAEEMRMRMPPKDERAPAHSRLRAVGLGYIAFARAEPGWFDTAFFGQPDDPAVTMDLVSVSVPAPFTLLIGALDDMVDAGELSTRRREGAEWACWSSVHGFAQLVLHGPLSSQSDEVVTLLAERVVDDIIAGIH